MIGGKMAIKPMTVKTIAELIGGSVEGDATVEITGVAPIDAAGPGEITFAMDDRRAAKLKTSKAAAAIVPQGDINATIPLIRVENVDVAMARLLGEWAGDEDLPPKGVHPSASISRDAEVADNVAVGPGAVIGPGAKVSTGCSLCANVVLGAGVVLGEDVVLEAGVVVYHDCLIGKHVRIGANSVIGSEGFGYYSVDGAHHRIPHIGNVVIEDDVEIGACSCVDRAKFGSTRIGAGTKIDDLVLVGHNVQVGKGCILVGQSGIAGSTKLGDHVVLGGAAGVRDNISVGSGVQCAAFGAIASDIPDGQVVAGIPALPVSDAFRIIKATAKLPELLKRVRHLETRLKEIESTKDS